MLTMNLMSRAEIVVMTMRTCRACGGTYSRRVNACDCYLWRYVDKNGPVHPVLGTPCWPWVGALFPNGYGRHGNYGAHRRAWIATHGKISKKMVVMHKCDNPPCCNPDHLTIGTNKANSEDMVAKGRSAKLHGTKNPNGSLPDATVIAVREAGEAARANGASRMAAAKQVGPQFGVPWRYALSIIRGERRSTTR